MKNILIYGDSITWGRIPAAFGRYDENIRFSKVLEKELGKGYHVIEEGLRARMVKEKIFTRLKGIEGSSFDLLFLLIFHLIFG